MKKIFLPILIAVMVLLLVGCNSAGDNAQNDQPDDGQKENAVDLQENENDKNAHYNTINIIVNDQTLYTASYESDEDITALDLLKKICEDNDVEYKHLDGYVNSIAGYTNGSESGWLYFFNGEMPDVSASNYTILKGFDNTIDFKYMSYAVAFPD